MALPNLIMSTALCRAVAALAFAASASTAQPHSSGSVDQKLVVLTQAEAERFGAMCLDGSPPAIYYAPARGEENQDNWVLYFKGGGWCWDERSCADRSQTVLGTTTILPELMKDTWDHTSGPLHPNATVNPTFANFHRVVLWYCDGASFAGRVEAPVHNATSHGKPVAMHFRGQQVLSALLGKLKEPEYGLGRAKQVLLTGCSAGGMSVYLHADAVAAAVANPALTRFKAASLSGFFLDHPTATGVPLTHDNYAYMFRMQNMTGGVNQACVAAQPPSTGAVGCSTPQANYAHIRAPFFVLNSMLDAYQMSAILQVGCPSVEKCNATQIAEMKAYQESFYQTITGIETFSNPGNGAFLYNCDIHCAEQDANGFNQFTLPHAAAPGGPRTLMEEALAKWWAADLTEPASAHTYIERCTLQGPRPCNPTCGA